MSLQHAAHYLASRGRGPDDSLVHMTRREVQSLQDIARAHGGSLTVNPDTGLVEAGFLKNLLPMIAGAGITALTGGAAAPWMIGLGVGGVQAARTGSLEKGLMAGLGAYGGSGLMSGLTGSAATTVSEGAKAAAGAGDPTAGMNAMSGLDKVKYGIQGLGTEAGRAAALQNLGGGFGAAKTAGMALAPALMDSGDQSPPPSDNERYNYSFDPGRVTDPNAGYTGAATGERTYFRPSYTRLPNTKGFNEGGIAHFDEGGDTSDVPPPRPNTALLQGAAAMNNVRPFTGNVPFAQPATSSAQVGSIQPTSSNPFYTMTGESGDAYRYLMGLGPTSAATNPVIATKPNITTQPTGDVGGGGGGGGASPIMGGASVGNTTAPTEVDPYDQEGQDAINKIEEEVANEQYDQDRQDAIDRYEQSLYDQEGQDAVTRVEDAMREEALAENANALDIDNATISTDPVFAADDGTTSSIEDTIRQITPVPETPEELLNRDEFGDLQGAIDRQVYDQEGIDAVARVEEALRNEALVQEDPYGNLDAAIAANNYEDSRRASDIDAATIAVDNYDTYSGFKPEPANPNIPVEDRAPEPAQPEPAPAQPEPAAPAIMDEIYRSADNDDRNPYYSDTTEEVQPWQNAVSSPDEDFPSTYPMETEEDYEYGGSDTYGLDGYYLGDLGGFGGGFRKNELQAESREHANGGLMAAHRYAMGGSTLGGYSDGGRLLRGPGDGVSDSIPATIGKKRQPARLADGEFVIPARIVSELGNGSTEAGARKLYAMMERIQATRGRTVGKNRVATNSRADRYLPA